MQQQGGGLCCQLVEQHHRPLRAAPPDEAAAHLRERRQRRPHALGLVVQLLEQQGVLVAQERLRVPQRPAGLGEGPDVGGSAAPAGSAAAYAASER